MGCGLLWVGRARRFVSSVKADIDRELAAEELKKTLGKHAGSESLYEIIEQTKQSVDSSAGSSYGPQNKTSPAVSDKSHDANG